MLPSYEAEACLSLHANTQDLNQSIVATVCPAVWDGFICWSPTVPGATASHPCPTTAKGVDATNTAFRECGPMGKWLDRNRAPGDIGWTNYTSCFTPVIREIMRRLGSQDEAQTKMDIANNTRILEFVGLSLSLTALVLSLLIFHKFRTLRNSRTRLHRHLFVAMVIQVAIRLTLYIDQAVTRANQSPQTKQPLSQDHLRGIDNTPILCEAGYICLEYARTAMFMWMFVEGLYLHNMVTVTVFEEKLSPLIYSIVGWVVPIPLTLAWAVATAMNYGTATCWWGYNFTLYFWILEGPRLGVLMVNLAFLLNILRVLVTKLRRSNSSETHQARKAVKAALLLLPLLGLTNLLNMLDAPLEKSAWVFGTWSYFTHLLTSCQGFILACLYCFNNGEVQIALKKYFRTKIMGRNKFRVPVSSVRMTLLNHSVVANTDGRISGSPGLNQTSTPRSLRVAAAAVRLKEIQQQAKLDFNHLKTSNNNGKDNEKENSSDSEIGQVNKEEDASTMTATYYKERIGELGKLQRILVSNKRNSHKGLHRNKVSSSGTDSKRIDSSKDRDEVHLVNVEVDEPEGEVTVPQDLEILSEKDLELAISKDNHNIPQVDK